MGKQRWLWWVGEADAVEEESTYNLGAFSTREEAIRRGVQDTDPGDAFYVIEALTSGCEHDRDEDDREPFIAARNCEKIVNDWTET